VTWQKLNHELPMGYKPPIEVLCIQKNGNIVFFFQNSVIPWYRLSLQ
jgi:hypothetical protein